jgi:hypothetical protein
MKILEEYILSENDWDQLSRAIQAIQEDKTSVTIWTKRKNVSRWLYMTHKIDAVRELCDERQKQII